MCPLPHHIFLLVNFLTSLVLPLSKTMLSACIIFQKQKKCVENNEIYAYITHGVDTFLCFLYLSSQFCVHRHTEIFFVHCFNLGSVFFNESFPNFSCFTLQKVIFVAFLLLQPPLAKPVPY